MTITPNELLKDHALDILLDGDATEVDYFLARAVRAIDHQFGAGFAQANPALVGAYIQAAATTRATVGAGIVEEAGNHIAGAICELAEAMRLLSEQSEAG